MRVHPVVPAGRQREDEHRMVAVQDRLHQARQGEATQVDGQHRRARPRLLQQGRRLLGVVRLADQQLDVAELLLRLGQASLHRLDLLGVGVPAAVFRSGGAGEDDADPRFPGRLRRRVGGPGVRPRRREHQPARRAPLPGTPVSCSVHTWEHLPYELQHPRNDQIARCVVAIERPGPASVGHGPMAATQHGARRIR